MYREPGEGLVQDVKQADSRFDVKLGAGKSERCDIYESENWLGTGKCKYSWECRGARMCEGQGWCYGDDGCEEVHE